MSIQVMEDEQDLLGEHQAPRFRKVPTLPAAIVQILLCVGQITLVFVLPSLYDHKNTARTFGSFSLLIYTHSAHWAAFLIIDQFLHHHHHKSRLQGYLDFYVRTKNIRRAPFYILSVGNAVLMIVVMILHDISDNNPNINHNFTKVDYLRGLITLESMVVMCLVVSYIYILRDHNSKELPPDVLREEFSSSIVLPNRPRSEVVGYQEPDQVMEVMERQAEMIRYLHEHTDNLCRKIQVLTTQLSQKERMT